MPIVSQVPGIKNSLEINTALKTIVDQVNTDTTAIALKAPAASPTFTTKATFDFATASTAPVLNASKELVSSAVTATELNYVHGQTGTVKAAASAVSAGDDTANTKTIVTGLTAIIAKVVQIMRANIDVTGDAVISVSSGSIVVADGSTYVLTDGDIINWIAVGTIA